jgi:DNA-binding NarL/FixJ family response regulator
MNTEITILIADDHPIVRQGLRQVIERDATLQIIAEANNGSEAIEKVRKLQPHVIILDIDMPEMDGFTAARTLHEEGLASNLIFLTVHREEQFFHAALELGAQGYVLKDSAVSDIVTAIKAVAAGQHFVSAALTSALIHRTQRSLAQTPHLPSIHDLTPTERRVVQLLAQYKTSRQIADELGISHRTVQTHRQNICQKLNLQGQHALVKFALANQESL